jgi:hypothetical protein
LASVDPNKDCWDAYREGKISAKDPQYREKWWSFTQSHSLFGAIWSSEEDFKDCKANRTLHPHVICHTVSAASSCVAHGANVVDS